MNPWQRVASKLAINEKKYGLARIDFHEIKALNDTLEPDLALLGEMLRLEYYGTVGSCSRQEVEGWINKDIPARQALLMYQCKLTPQNLLEPNHVDFKQPTAYQVSRFFYYTGYTLQELGSILGLKDEKRGRYWVKALDNGGKPIPGAYWDYLLIRFNFVRRNTLEIKSKQ